MKSIEMSGKTVEDAVKAGLQELGCDSSEVTIDVLHMGSPGLFGMFGKLAKVRLTVKEDDPDSDFNLSDIELSLNKQSAKKGSAEKKSPEKKPQEKKNQEKKESRPQEKTEAEPAPQAEERRETEIKEDVPAPQPFEPREEIPFEATDPETLGEAGRTAYDFLKTVTAKMGVTVDIQVIEEEDHLTVAMMGDSLGILIGRRGETLDALQYLTSLQVNKHREGYLRVSLDSEHYRHKREEALSKLAMRMAARARKTGRKVTLEPMNPYERRILHSALQNNPYVTTHSEGEEPYRRVVITLQQDGEDR